MKLKGLIFLVMMMASGLLLAQNDDQILHYINSYKGMAISEMQRSGIPASIILSPAIPTLLSTLRIPTTRFHLFLLLDLDYRY